MFLKIINSGDETTYWFLHSNMWDIEVQFFQRERAIDWCSQKMYKNSIFLRIPRKTLRYLIHNIHTAYFPIKLFVFQYGKTNPLSSSIATNFK